MLELNLILPGIGMLCLMLISREEVEELKKVALEWSVWVLSIIVITWGYIDGEGEFSPREEVEGIVLGVDGISIYFIILTGILIPICILISWESVRYMMKEYLLCILLIEILLIGVFSVLGLMSFYVLFEGVLIPMFLIIGIWGSREEKIQAAYYFFIYTLAGSVLMLLGILVLYGYGGTTDYEAWSKIELSGRQQEIVFIGFVIGLGVKIPSIPFHIWLPLAHVEAPVAGSVILAGVLLKIGGYGLVRFCWPLLPEASEYYSPLIEILSILAIIYGSMTTCRQIDLKRIVAYSSIAHMGLVTMGIFSKTVEGQIGGIYLMVSHGLVSSGLFIGVGYLYERHGTRLIRYYRGMIITMPIFGVMLLLLVLANMGIPGSSNFVGELISLLGGWEYSRIVGIWGSLGMVMSAGYSIYMYNRVCYGNYTRYLGKTRDLKRREYWGLLPLIVLTYLMGVYPWIIIDVVKSVIIRGVEIA